MNSVGPPDLFMLPSASWPFHPQPPEWILPLESEEKPIQNTPLYSGEKGMHR